MAISEDEKDIIASLAKGAVEGTGKNLPIYKDVLQPTAQVVGQGLKNIVTIALSPLSLTMWGFEQMSNWLQPIIIEKLKNIAPEKIIPPKLSIAGPLFESLRYLENEIELRDMFAQLLANAMNENTEARVHPGFVETVKNMSGYDAQLFKYVVNQNYPIKVVLWSDINYYNQEKNYHKIFCSCKFHLGNDERFEASLSNLVRLGVLNLKESNVFNKDEFFLSPEAKLQSELAKKSDRNLSYSYTNRLSEYGKFLSEVVLK